MSDLTIIVAFDAKQGIGIQNTLPWRLPEDLARFKQITTGHAILMGRKTFESIGRPLPNRRNIVLTRNSHWQPEGVEVVNSLEQALLLIGEQAAFVIGGADIYAQTLPLCQRLLVTEIHRDVVCDAFFPSFDKRNWQETECKQYHSEPNQFDYAFVTYQKTSNQE